MTTHNVRPMPDGVGLYLHVPFCVVKCHYCDFACSAGLQSLMAPYVSALLTEMSHYDGLDVASVYLGGGTPSLLGPDLLARVLDGIHRRFRVHGAAEITLEANPGSAAPELWRVARAGGVNRVSVGVQALDDPALERLGRNHTAADAVHALLELREAGLTDVSIDLIYGLPDQTLEAWESTVRGSIGLGPDHFSVYSLQIEERTVFGAQHRAGRLSLPGEEVERLMHDLADSGLEAAGYGRYEVSSWCRPGHESVHNRIYWHNRPYVGLGSGAHSYFDGRRYANDRSIKGYLRDPRPPVPALPQPKKEEIEETVFMGLRLVREGLSRRRFAARFGTDVRAIYGREIDRLVAIGMLEETDEALRLTRAAIPIANDVFAAFLRS